MCILHLTEGEKYYYRMSADYRYSVNERRKEIKKEKEDGSYYGEEKRNS